jgi:hypothetical protein
MSEASVSFAGNLTDQPEVRHSERGIARATLRVAVSGRREGEASFFTVVVWRDQAEHATQSLSRAAGWWSWADCSSGAGPPRTAAPARRSRSWPRSWGRVCGGRPPRQSEPPGATASSWSRPRRPDDGSGAGRLRFGPGEWAYGPWLTSRRALRRHARCQGCQLLQAGVAINDMPDVTAHTGPRLVQIADSVSNPPIPIGEVHHLQRGPLATQHRLHYHRTQVGREAAVLKRPWHNRCTSREFGLGILPTLFR